MVQKTEAITEVQKLMKIMEKPCKLIFNEGKKDLETVIELNQPELFCSLKRKDVTILYDQKSLDSNLSCYLTQQAKMHEQYNELVRKELMEKYHELNEMVEKNSEIKKALEFVPDDMQKRLISISKLIMGPSSWVQAKSLKSEFEKAIDRERYSITAHIIFKDFFKYGATFLERNRAKYNERLQEAERELLEDCLQKAKDMSGMYQRMIDTTQKEITELKELRNVFYPLKPDVQD
jgi:hypothetical protein